MVVYSPEQEYRGVAERISDDRNESLVTSLDADFEDETVLCVVPPSVDEETLFTLQRRLLQYGPEDGGFSIITGYTPELAEELYYNDADDGTGHKVLMNEGPRDLSTDDETSVFVRQDATAESLRSASDDRLCSLTLQSGGWPIHVRLGEGYLCGFPETQQLEEYPGPVPYCIEDGKRECPLSDEEDLVSAEALDVSHAFISSCASMTDNGTCGLPVHVGMGLLNGTKSLIGSYRPGVHQPHESILHYSLVRAGYDVVERCYVLNQNSQGNDVMSYPYVPFGNPDLRPPSGPSEYRVTVDGGDEAEVRVEDVDAYVVDTEIPADRVEGSGDRLYVYDVSESETENPVHYVAFEDDGSYRLMLYSGSRMTADELRFRASSSPYGDKQRRIATESLANAQEHRTYGIVPDDAEPNLENLEHQLSSLRRALSQEKYDATAYEEAEKQLQSLFGNVDSIRDELVSLFDSGQRVKIEYLRKAVESEVYPTERQCPTCDRRLFVKQTTYPQSEADRALGLCPQCGSDVFDVPMTGVDDDPTYPVVRSNGGDSSSSERTVTVEFENPTDEPMQATFHPTVWQHGETNHDDEQLFAPNLAEVELGPGERTTQEFTLDAGLLRENQHYVLCRVIGNLAVYSGSAVVQVGEKRSHVNPDYQ